MLTCSSGVTVVGAHPVHYPYKTMYANTSFPLTLNIVIVLFHSVRKWPFCAPVHSGMDTGRVMRDLMLPSTSVITGDRDAVPSHSAAFRALSGFAENYPIIYVKYDLFHEKHIRIL